MTIVSLKPGKTDDTRRLELSDGSLFSFKPCYLGAVFFDDTRYTAGTELSPGEEEQFRFASSCLRGEKAALRLVGRAEQTGFGLGRKLEKAGYPRSCVNAVLARLRELNIVDDSRYARMWLQARLGRRAEGPRRLLAALRQRGISRQDAETALLTVLNPAAEKALLDNYLKKNRLPETGGTPDIARILKREGFSPDLIRSYREDL
ncbi:MAG: RecX family transcriptional regulator [Treponema sp.]|jgi:regulatory protein|nr:RecX family transcriptional regulator [Treponema sp.]